MAPVVLRRCPDYGDLDPVLDEVLEASGIDGTLGMARRVLLKPNLMRGVSPEECQTTHPAFLAALTRRLRHRGIEVFVGDSSGLIGFTGQVLEASGVAAAVTREGGRVLNLDAGPFRSLAPVGRPPVAFLVPEVLFQVDGVLSVPKVKTHPLMVLSLSIKNLMGILPGAVKPSLHVFRPGPDDLAEALLDLYRSTSEAGVRWLGGVVDGVWALGGRGGRVPPCPRQDFGLLAAGPSLVELDLACAVAAGFDPREVPLCRRALARGPGPARIEDLEVDGPDPRSWGDSLRPPGQDWMERDPRLTRIYYWTRARLVRPTVDSARCRGHEACVPICPVSAIRRVGGRTRIDSPCVRCMACIEHCPEKAIGLGSPWPLGFLYRKRLRSMVGGNRP